MVSDMVVELVWMSWFGWSFFLAATVVRVVIRLRAGHEGGDRLLFFRCLVDVPTTQSLNRSSPRFGVIIGCGRALADSEQVTWC